MNSDKCILGWGTVGKCTALTFGIEKYYSRSDANITLEEASKCKFIFICLPTPTVEGVCDTSAITEIIKKLQTYPDFSNATIIIRSTVYAGYNKYLQAELGLKNIVSNPEFLSEDTWEKDAVKPMLVVIGSDDVDARERVAGLYRGRFKYNEPIITNSITAEMIKYSLNVFFATKVIFANEVYDYSQKIGANYETIRQTLQAHPWGSKNHLQVFNKGGRGAGGKCLKKDLEAFSKAVGSSIFLEATNQTNHRLLTESGKK